MKKITVKMWHRYDFEVEMSVDDKIVESLKDGDVITEAMLIQKITNKMESPVVATLYDSDYQIEDEDGDILVEFN